MNRTRCVMSKWHVIQSPTDSEMFAVKSHYEYGELHPEYIVADSLPLEDATLIAAAPDLLQALEDLINNCECRETGTVIADFSRKTPVDHARAAIAKAKGGEE